MAKFGIKIGQIRLYNGKKIRNLFGIMFWAKNYVFEISTISDHMVVLQ